MSGLEFKNGYASEYDDMVVYVEEFKEGAKAARIERRKDLEPCEVIYGMVKTVFAQNNDFSSSEEFKEACEKHQGADDVTAEFITDDDTYFVIIELNSPTEKADFIVYEHVDFS